MPSIIKCCYKCPDRKIVDGVRCHSWCERYAEEAALNDGIMKDIQYKNDVRDFVNSSIIKTKKRVNQQKPRQI